MNRQLSRQWVEITAMLAFAWKTTVEELKWRFTELCLCPDISTVKSKILPIVFVEDIPVKALMPNLVQLYQKTLLLWNVQEQTPSCFWRDFSDAILFFGQRTSLVENFQQFSFGLDYGYACICRKNQVGNQFRKTPKWFWVLEGNDLKKSWKWRCKQSFASARTFHPQSIVKSKILPIAFIEDIPVKAFMPNLVQLYQNDSAAARTNTWIRPKYGYLLVFNLMY